MFARSSRHSPDLARHFDGAWARRTEQTLRGLLVPFMGRADLIATKRASGRRKDLGDLELLGET